MSEQAKFEAWWNEKGFNSVILRAAAWTAWMARAELKDPLPPVNQPDPDEWVVQDRVIPRNHIDQWKWVGHDERANDVHWSSMQGNFTHYKHGDESYGETLHVRCRRRDLPPAEPRNREEALAHLVEEGQKLGMYDPQPAKTRVRLWMRCDGGQFGSAVVASTFEKSGDWREIHHDAEGLYVEGQR